MVRSSAAVKYGINNYEGNKKKFVPDSTTRTRKVVLLLLFLTLSSTYFIKTNSSGIFLKKNHQEVFGVPNLSKKGILIFVTLHICYYTLESHKHFKEYILKLYAHK